MGERTLRGEGREVAKMPLAIRKLYHYHHHKDDPVTANVSSNGRVGVKMSHLDYQSLSHQNQLLQSPLDCTDVKINYKSNSNNIIRLLRETRERDYEDGPRPKCL